MSIEDISIALGEIKGNLSKGPALFDKQGCVACHALKKDEVQKGPLSRTDRWDYGCGPDCHEYSSSRAGNFSGF
jgi:mono/diheme cytochrome c family protein